MRTVTRACIDAAAARRRVKADRLAKRQAVARKLKLDHIAIAESTADSSES